ncbi:MAG: MBL fold metallo-hydrolase [Solirubrobacterales bacterium]
MVPADPSAGDGLGPGDAIQRIVAPNAGPFTLEGTNTYLVGTDGCWILDPGPADSDHLAAVDEAATERGGALGVVLTHGHDDHSEGAGEFGVEVHRPGEGETFGPLQAIATPGHSPDHVCLLWDRICFAGDLVLGHGSSIVGTEPDALRDTMSSLRRLAQLDLDRLLPGHGPPVEDPRAKISEYLEHRAERERKLLDALTRGVRSREELLDHAWGDVPDAMRPAADVAMQAHLDKLADDGLLPEEVET